MKAEEAYLLSTVANKKLEKTFKESKISHTLQRIRMKANSGSLGLIVSNLGPEDIMYFNDMGYKTDEEKGLTRISWNSGKRKGN